MNNLRPTIDAYYAARQMTSPDDSESLLWLLSEIGELVDAWLRSKERNLSPDTRFILDEAVTLGVEAERIVASTKRWIRNNQPKGSIELGGEIGDVLMMLDRFALAIGESEPETLLRYKMHTKLRSLGLLPPPPDF